MASSHWRKVASEWVKCWDRYGPKKSLFKYRSIVLSSADELRERRKLLQDLQKAIASELYEQGLRMRHWSNGVVEATVITLFAAAGDALAEYLFPAVLPSALTVGLSAGAGHLALKVADHHQVMKPVSVGRIAGELSRSLRVDSKGSSVT